MSEQLPKLVSAHDMAKVLACSRETVRRMARAGEIPSIKVRQCLRLDPAAVLEALKEKQK